MAEQGLKAYCFSVAWTRVLPNGRGEVNEDGLAFYANLIDELLSYGIEPVVTLYHWDLPQCLQEEYGGWESRQVIDDFVNYAKVLFERFGDKVKYWVSLNEQNIFTSLGYQLAMHLPGLPIINVFIGLTILLTWLMPRSFNPSMGWVFLEKLVQVLPTLLTTVLILFQKMS